MESWRAYKLYTSVHTASYSIWRLAFSRLSDSRENASVKSRKKYRRPLGGDIVSDFLLKTFLWRIQ